MLFERMFHKNAKLAFVLALTLMVSVATFFPSQSVHAATGFYFNGGWKFVSNNGAAVTIETQNPYVAPSSWVSIWAMTGDRYGSGYAQVGWWKVAGYSSSKYFYEYCYDPYNVWYQKELGTATAGSHNNFKVGCDSIRMYFIINGISYGNVSLTTIPFSRNVIQLLGETHNTNDQCPGSLTNPVSMGSAQYKNTSNSWVSATCSNAGDLGQGYGDLTTMRNNISSSGSTNWEVWDSRYY